VRQLADKMIKYNTFKPLGFSLDCHVVPFHIGIDNETLDGVLAMVFSYCILNLELGESSYLLLVPSLHLLLSILRVVFYRLSGRKYLQFHSQFHNFHECIKQISLFALTLC
jgi:hypothetical protein